MARSNADTVNVVLRIHRYPREGIKEMEKSVSWLTRLRNHRRPENPDYMFVLAGVPFSGAMATFFCIVLTGVPFEGRTEGPLKQAPTALSSVGLS